MNPPLEILYRDEDLIAVNKPYGYLVHKSSVDIYATEIIVQTLRDQIDQYVYPIHRLDRKTSGVLLLGLNKQTLKDYNKAFQEKSPTKIYHAIVRGYTDDTFRIDYPILNKGKMQESLTLGKTLAKAEMPWPSGGFPTSRYSLVELQPITGKMHQLRKHMAHIFHPIIGDRPHGCNKQNKFFKSTFNLKEMLLHASQLSIPSFESYEKLRISASFPTYFNKMADKMGWELTKIMRGNVEDSQRIS